MDYGLTGKKAVVLAGTLGLGRATALQLAGEGCTVTVCSSRQANVDAFAAEGRERGLDLHGRVADLNSKRDIDDFFAFALEKMGGVDILVTNCGGPPAGLFADHDDETWYGAVDQVLLSAIRSIRHVLPGMQERGWGRIVAITSIAVKSPVPNLILSNSIRAGLTGCLKTLASEVGGGGVTVNTACPGYTRTDRLDHLMRHRAQLAGRPVDEIVAELTQEVPAGRFATPDEFASLVCYLCSEQAASINGVAYQVDGGAFRGLL